VTEDGHRSPGFCGERRGDRGDILEFALDRIGRRVTRLAAPAPVDGVDGEVRLQPRPERAKRRVIGRRAVDEEEGGTGTGTEDRYGGPVA
jgi:hypothetical protein